MKHLPLLFLFLLAPLGVQGQVYSLDDCRRLALENNAAVRNAALNVRAAELQQREAFTNYFPRVSAGGGWFRANKDMLATDLRPADLLSTSLSQTLSSLLPAEALSLLGTPVSLSLMRNGTLGTVSAMQPVFAGGQIVNGNRLARLGTEVQRLQYRQSEQQTTQQTDDYYWQLVSLKEKVLTLDAVDEMLKKLESDADMAVKAGIRQRNDLLQVQLKQNETAAARLQLNNGIRLTARALAQHIGVEWTESFDIEATDILSLTPEHPEAWRTQHADALTMTPEYGLLHANVQAQQLNKRMEVGKRLPTVAVGAGLNYTDIMDTQRTYGMVFATLSIPISDWWGGSHAVKRQQLRIETAQNDLRNNGDLLMIRMQQCYDELDNAYQQTLLARKSIEQATENLRLNTDYYRAGTAAMSDLLQAQTLYQQARNAYVDAYTAYQTAKTRYFTATGRGI